ncbi:hypothetical protein [Blautia hydrogenotrophica]|uniref:hypothetical protein n=1 Tax=Blautia hydrogenotrophica TaxID=53443 RepID=UPI002E75EB11|nr:hypothetical protein [Blautia hydrogenotrophica]MEE0462412.1 hypothetical protein [Blautia hydrogenotrophica]
MIEIFSLAPMLIMTVPVAVYLIEKYKQVQRSILKLRYFIAIIGITIIFISVLIRPIYGNIVHFPGEYGQIWFFVVMPIVSMVQWLWIIRQSVLIESHMKLDAVGGWALYLIILVATGGVMKSWFIICVGLVVGGCILKNEIQRNGEDR